MAALEANRKETSEEVISHLLRYVVRCAVPLRHLEDVDLCRFVQALSDSRLPQMISRHQARARIMAASQTQAHRLADALETTSWSMSADTWTARDGANYLLILAHRAEGSELAHDVLGLVKLGKSKTAATLTTHIQRASAPPMKAPSSLTTDNEPTMKATARRLGLMHVPCAVHLLQLAVRDCLRSAGFEALERYINGLSKSYRYGRGKALLAEACAKHDLKPLRTQLSCATRWGSFYAAAKKLHYLSPAIRSVAGNENLPDIAPETVRVMKVIVDVFGAADRATRSASVANMRLADALSWIQRVTSEMEVVFDVEDEPDDDQPVGVADEAKEFSTASSGTDTENESEPDDDDYVDDVDDVDDDDGGGGGGGGGVSKVVAPAVTVQECRGYMRDAVQRRFRTVLAPYKRAALFAPRGLAGLLDEKKYEASRSALTELINECVPQRQAAPVRPLSKAERVLAREEERESIGVRFLSEALRAVEDSAAKFWTAERKARFPELYLVAEPYLLAPMASVTAERCFSLIGRQWSPGRGRLAGSTAEALLRLRLACSREPALQFPPPCRKRRQADADGTAVAAGEGGGGVSAAGGGSAAGSSAGAAQGASGGAAGGGDEVASDDSVAAGGAKRKH
jgi:hypothetical protein